MTTTELPPLPAEMEHLPRDKRGLPIPFIVYRDAEGEPDFRINNIDAVARCLNEGLCAISGLPMGNDDVWFIGGDKSAYHPCGAYIDPPAKGVCARWALQVCPFLAMPSFVGFKSTTPKDPDAIVAVNEQLITGKPAFFVLARTNGFTINFGGGDATMHPNRPWLAVEHWKDGAQIATLTRKQIIDRLEKERKEYKTEQGEVPIWKRKLNRGEGKHFPWSGRAAG